MPPERLILIPGMGADERLFHPQARGGIAFEPVRFPAPGRTDDLRTYAARIAEQASLDSTCTIGGVSFGGMVACELARICRPRRLLLIASCSGGEALPSYYRLVEWCSRLIPDALIRRRAEASSRILARLESLDEEQTELIRQMSMAAPIDFLRRVGRMIVRWKGVRTFPCPVHHIHGERDHIIPIAGLRPDEIIPDGGHLINLTHAEQVNTFIRRHAPAASSPPSAFVA